MLLRLLIMSALALNVGYATASVRNMLWWTVEVCKIDNLVSGLPTPCLAVRNSEAARSGYAIVRSPADKSHVIVSPTVRMIGIESPALLAPGAPNYLNDAWNSRSFAFPSGLPPVRPQDIGLAINSRQGRTQDQFHVHIDCIDQGVQRRVAAAMSSNEAGGWTFVRPLDDQPLYEAILLPQGSLNQLNEIKIAANHLSLGHRNMANLTISIIMVDLAGISRFVLLAREEKHGDGHAELLLDHDCHEYIKNSYKSFKH